MNNLTFNSLTPELIYLILLNGEKKGLVPMLDIEGTLEEKANKIYEMSKGKDFFQVIEHFKSISNDKEKQKLFDHKAKKMPIYYEKELNVSANRNKSLSMTEAQQLLVKAMDVNEKIYDKETIWLNRKCELCETSNSMKEGKSVLKTCSACKEVFYCSRECQVKDWSKHKIVCKNFKKIEANKK